MDELAEALADEYDAPIGDLRTGAEEMIDAFGAKGLLATSIPAGAA